MRYSVPAVRAVQNGQEVFLAFIPASVLSKINLRVEHFDAEKPYDAPEQGYQRTIENNRARRFARYLEQPDAISPTAIMVNDRHSQTEFNPKTGMLSIDGEKPVFTYDGQHRDRGYEMRFEADDSFGTFPVPVVITRGMSKLAEMIQFRTINTTAKGVATALVNAILAKVHFTEGDDGVDASTHRSIVCYKVTEAVNGDPQSPWFGLIVLANQKPWTKRECALDPSRENTRVINANSFVDALRPVHDYLVTHMMAATIDEKVERIQSVVTEFWSAVKSQMPDAFESPSEFALFRSGGVGPMHFVLRDLLGKI